MNKTYNILFGDSLPELIENVNYDIDNGWVPQGGVAVILKESGNRLYYQAMIKEYKKCTTPL